MSLPIDPRAITALREIAPDEPGFLRELIDVFLADTPLRLGDVDRAIVARDASLLTRAAHTIKGSAGNFGAVALTDLAVEMERYGREGLFAEAATRAPAFREEYARVAAALQHHR